VFTPTSSQITQEPVTTNPYVDTGQTDHTTTVISQSDKTQVDTTISKINSDTPTTDVLSESTQVPTSVETHETSSDDVMSTEVLLSQMCLLKSNKKCLNH
jgi:hypothetical protein